ncbi:MAG: ATP-binding protein [Pseudomonadota bacterium]
MPGIDSLLQEPWFQAFFDSLPFPTLILDPQMVVRQANVMFLQYYAISLDQVVGRPCYWVFHHFEHPCPPALCRFQAALDGQSGCVNLHQHKDKNGQMNFEEVHLTALRSPEGATVGVLESIINISLAKRLEFDLMQANEFLNRLLDSMVGVVVATDLDGHLLFVNKNVEKVLGYSTDELMGKSLRHITPDMDLRQVRRNLQHNGGRSLSLKTVARTRYGQEVPVRINASLVFREDQPVGTVGVITDLREHMKMEDKLAQAQMQVVQSEKLAHLGRMAAGVAHELNNPLTGITVFTELLKESLPADSPAQADLSGILQDAERCRDIVRDLLDYSHQSQIVVEDIELSQVVTEALGLIRDDSVFLHVEIDRQFHPEPLPIQGDMRLLRQVFINLIMNAVDAMEGKGRLTLKTYLDKDGMRVAEIGDTGPGIPAEHLSRVFDPFFTTKEIGKGTGLGLSVAYGVVGRHGGDIRVAKSDPEGTVFQVRMPPSAAQEILTFARCYQPNSPPPASEVAS